MGKLLAGIDYSSASAQALRALIPLRQAGKHTIVIYHAYQLPKGLPFLSPNVIEDMEIEAQREAQHRLKQFFQEVLPAEEVRRLQVITQRDFVSEGIRKHLQTGRYLLLAIGARGEDVSESENVGFHARHFIYHSPVPVLMTFPNSQVRWKKLLLAYEGHFRSPVGGRVLRQIVQKLELPVVGIPLLRSHPTLGALHKRMQSLTRATSYLPATWEKEHLVRLLLEAAHSYEADVIAYFGEPGEILQGMQQMREGELDHEVAWLFFPQAVEKEYSGEEDA